MNSLIPMRARIVAAFLALPAWSQAATYSLTAGPGTGAGSMMYDDATNR